MSITMMISTKGRAMSKRETINEATADGVVEEVIFDEMVTYCWVDAAGRRVSAIHRGLGPALTYVADWPAHQARCEWHAAKALEEWEAEQADATARGREPRSAYLNHFERRMSEVRELQRRLTLTGEPPARLLRLITRTTVEQPTELEISVAEAAVAEAFGNNESSATDIPSEGSGVVEENTYVPERLSLADHQSFGGGC